MKELKKCPFCGGEAEYTERGNQHIGIKETVVKCKRCNTKQVHKWMKMRFDFERIEQLTVEAWNRRAEQ